MEEFGAQFGLPGGGLLDLQKALEAGYVTDATAMVGGGALRVESLEPLLKIMTFQEKHMPFWKMIPKTKAFSTVEEYTELASYGQHDFVFNAEGELPETQDSEYNRRAAFAKFLGTVRKVTHPMTLVRTQVGDVIGRQNMDGIMWILSVLENKLFYGQSNLTVGGASEGVEFDGILRQLQTRAPADNIIDLAGRGLAERDVRNGGQVIQANAGNPTHLISNPKVMEDYAKKHIPGEKIILPTPQGTLESGFVIDAVRTAAGKVSLVGDIFIKRTYAPPTTAINSDKAPNAAPASVTPAVAGADGLWARAYPTGVTVRYKVTFVNNKGETVATESATQAVTTLTNHVALTIANPGGGFTTAPTACKIYRKDDPGTTGVFGEYSLIARIPITTIAGAGTTVFTDINEKMPNTYDAFMGQLDSTVLEFRQLLPLVRMDLAVTAPAYQWMLLLYGVPRLYVPGRWVCFRNIKDEE